MNLSGAGYKVLVTIQILNPDS